MLPYNVILKPIGSVCNLECGYCYYLKTKQLYPGVTDFRMRPEVLETFIREYLKQDHVIFCWQGGEPTLLGIDFFRNALALIEKYRKPGQQVQHAFQTNGTLLNDAWCVFFKEHGFLVGISIDGPADLHDHYRRDRAGQSSHADVMRGLALLQKHGVEHNALVLLNEHNIKDPLQVYNFLVEAGIAYPQFIPCLELDEQGRVEPFSVPPGAYGVFLNAVFDIWQVRDRGKVFIQIIEEHLTALLGRMPSLCIHTPECGRALVVEWNGDVYACDHFVKASHRFGNIMKRPLAELVDGAEQKAFGKSKADLAPECRSCTWLTSCRGGCLKHRIIAGRNRYCADYQAFFEHSYPVLYRIAQDILTTVPAGAAKQAGRNAPCPCGSGKKYKSCCGK
jgi:uncharacterized protein